jgi:hypothetical protein
MSGKPRKTVSQETVMTISTETNTFDTPAYVAAIEGRDPEGQVIAFSADAELTVIDHELGLIRFGRQVS